MGRRERPIDPTAGPLAAFAFDLRMLRAKAGEPSYRKLSQRAGFSASSLAAAATGMALPSRQVTLAYVAACGGDVAEWALRWEATWAQRDQPQAATDEWCLPALNIVDGQRLALVEAVWRQWIHGAVRSAVEASGLIAPRLTGADGRSTDITGLAYSLHRIRRIVIVGTPGIGKTVAGLALTRELIAAGAHPVPVVVPLRAALVPAKSQHPHDWLCDEIRRSYGIPRTPVRSLLDNGQLLPVLDGLDTLPRANRVVTAHAINGIDPCVITCRTGVYEMVACLLGPHETITVQPLSMIQVHQHLPFSPSPDLAELLAVPAFLNTALRLPQPGPVDQTSVCAAFVRATPAGYPPHRAVHWLSWLARFPIFDPRRPRVDMLARRLRLLVSRGIRGCVAAVVLAGIGATSLLAARWWHETEGFVATSAAGLVSAMLALAGAICETYLRRALVLRLLIHQDALPQDMVAFLHSAHCAAMLDEAREGYRFAHPQLRQHLLRDAAV